MHRVISAPILAVFLLTTACAEGPFLTWEPETEAEREVRLGVERLDRTVTQATLLGTLGGGLLGALGGGAQGALQGAEIGRFGGAGAGSYVRGLQKKFADQEAVLDQVLLDINATNAALETSIGHMHDLLAERRSVAAGLRGSASAQRAAQEAARSTRNVGEMNKSIAAAEQRVAFFSSARDIVAQSSSLASPKLDPQIALMRERIKAMRDIASTLETEI